MSYQMVGKAVPRVEGGEKVTGGTQYASDVAVPGALWCKVLRSPVPHARIVNIDTSRAKWLAGVHEVLAGADLPDIFIGLRMKDMPILARDRVLFVGEPVVAVAAESADVADEALNLIDVQYEELPAVYDPEEALKPGSPVLHEDRSQYKNAPALPEEIPNLQSFTVWKHGDIEEGFKNADRTFEHTFSTQLTHHGYLEPHACTMKVDSDGKVEVWASNKGPYSLRDNLADILGIEAKQIKVHIMSVGGDFGGKASMVDAPICYFLAQRSGRPVKMVLGYDEELIAAAHRHPGVITLKTGVDRDGKITAMQADILFSGGAYAAFKANPPVTVLGGRRLASFYHVPAIHVVTRCAYTNQVGCTQSRTPGSPQIVFATESQMDIIAREIDLDPAEFRRRNIIDEGDPSPMGDKWDHIYARQTFEQAVKDSGWGRSKLGKNCGRGMAVYERGAPTGKASAAITIETDGSITLLTGCPDIGTGFYTVAQQIVCETLGAAPERVRIRFEDTDSLPYDPGTGGSKSTNTSGHAAYQVAREVRKRLVALAARRLGCSPEKIQQEYGRFVGPGRKAVSFDEVARAVVTENGGAFTHLTNYEPKDVPPVTAFTVQVAEVEVDPDTGQVKVKKITSSNDAGIVLNKQTYQAQVDGGVVTGLGFALMEETPMVDGRIVTANMGDFKLPSTKDIPKLNTVILESPTGPVPFRGKAIAELPNVPTAAAIANAVADAVGVRVYDLPIKAEKIYWGLNQK